MEVPLYFHNRFPGSSFLLPTFLTGGKLCFQVADLHLASVNFEPWTFLEGCHEDKTCHKMYVEVLSSHCLTDCAVVAGICQYKGNGYFQGKQLLLFSFLPPFQ